MREMTVEQFLADVAAHQMRIVRDDGVYRHLRFRSTGEHSWNLWFELVTWPQTLVIRGDMGTWAFSRVEDMFGFFRGRETLAINPGYWAEKCESVDARTGPCKQFSADAFKQAVLDSLENYGLPEAERFRIGEALRRDAFHTDDEYPLREAVTDFSDGEFTLSDTWEIDGREYTVHFLWCLYAIVWGIQQYDAAKAASPQPETAAAG